MTVYLLCRAGRVGMIVHSIWSTSRGALEHRETILHTLTEGEDFLVYDATVDDGKAPLFHYVP